LPTLARLRDESARCPILGVHPFVGELPHVAFLSSTHPSKLKYWGAFNYNASTSKPLYLRGYDYSEVRSFFDYTPELNVCLFDLPKSTLAKTAKGIQVLNWGAHGSLNDSVSNPSELFEQLRQRHGLHPALENDHAEAWQQEEIACLFDNLIRGIRLRTDVHRDLMARSDWDLFLVAYSELHSAGHALLHLEDGGHTMHPANTDEKPMLAVMQEIDTSLADLLRIAPKDAAINIFSTHGMVQNFWDICTMYFLPELLHRMAFPSRNRPPGETLPPPQIGTSWWSNAVWDMTFGTSRTMPKMEEGYNWIPSTWYVDDWPNMAAFSLPGFDEGMVRLNIKGRDRDGRIEPRNYDAALQIVSNVIRDLKNERTGAPLVNRIFRTRSDPFDDGSHLPPADLIVEWAMEPCDVAISPQVGRIGPVPLKRTGGHSRNGFSWIRDSRLKPGDYSAATAFDLGPTILDLIGVDLPNHFSGQSLLRDWQPRPDVALFEELP